MINYKFYVFSHRDISFKYEELITLNDLGYEEEEWSTLTEEEKEAILDVYCLDLLQDKYIRYGYLRVNND